MNKEQIEEMFELGAQAQYECWNPQGEGDIGKFAKLKDKAVKLFSIHGVVGSKDVQLMRDALLKSREDTARVREAAAIQQTLEIYCNHDELPTVNEVLERIGRKH